MADNTINSLIKLARPNHWIKNIFVMAPAFFAGTLAEPSVLAPVVIATFCFCLMSSAVYCFNDVRDAAFDRLSPEKCRRPVVSGAVSAGKATALAMTLVAVSLILAILCINARLVAILTAYLLINIAYTLYLKHLTLIDITIIAVGFLLRLWAGSVAAGCALSVWIVIVTFLLSLFLGLGKRREDVGYFEESGVNLRATAAKYSIKFIDAALALTGSATVTCYFLYTILPGGSRIITSEYFCISGLPVIVGILRYMEICIGSNKGGSHNRLLINDPVILICIVAYLILFFIFRYELYKIF